MPALSRADTSTLGRWWWTVDRWTLFAIFALIGCGYVMMLAASPAVAERIGQARNAFIFKQVGCRHLAALAARGATPRFTGMRDRPGADRGNPGDRS
jgi:cell division protein FtsW